MNNYTSKAPLLSITQTAKRFTVGHRTVRRWISAGKLRALWLGGVWRVREEDLRQFVEDNERERNNQLNAELFGGTL